MAFVSNALGFAGIGLPVLAMLLLIRGPFTRYFALFLFLLTSTIAWTTQGWVLATNGPSGSLYWNVFWLTELLVAALMFFVVIWLTANSLEGSPLRAKAMKVLTGITLAVIIVPFVAFRNPVFSLKWNQSVMQLLDFGAACMNLALWSALLLNRNRDRQLLAVSAGVGVIVAGAAVSLGVRQLTAPDSYLREIADVVYRVTQVAGPSIWCWTFWPPKKKRATPPATPQGEESPTPSIG